MKKLPDNSVDAVVTDPPYGLSQHSPADITAALTAWVGGKEYLVKKKGFMGKTWDSFVPGPELWRETLRVLKPGGHCLVFAGSRTDDLMGIALRMAGFEIRDKVMWLYGTGFPKSLNVAKAIDKGGLSNPVHIRAREHLAVEIRRARKAKGISAAEMATWFSYAEVTKNWERTDAGSRIPTEKDFNILVDKLGVDASFRDMVRAEDARLLVSSGGTDRRGDGTVYGLAHSGDQYEATTPAAKQWDGWGTALKPAFEPIIVARKPVSEKTVAANVLKHGTGGLNIDACRIEAEERINIVRRKDASLDESRNTYGAGIHGSAAEGTTTLGRWPANVIHDGSDEVEGAFAAFGSDKGQAANLKETGRARPTKNALGDMAPPVACDVRDELGSASRFFYSSKAGKTDRAGSTHPTVKPVSLMRYLVKLVTPPNGVVLDPFAGSGTTGQAALDEGFNAILMEREVDYQKDIVRRFEAAAKDRTDVKFASIAAAPAVVAVPAPKVIDDDFYDDDED